MNEKVAKNYAGIGTTYYGVANCQDNGSYITTKWFIIWHIPIVPLSSYQVKFRDRTYDYVKKLSTENYEYIKKVKLNIKQVFKTWVIMFMVIALIVLEIKFINPEGGFIIIVIFLTIVVSIWITSQECPNKKIKSLET